MSKLSLFPKDWREGRRLRAWQLYEQGWKQKNIAEALGVAEGAVSQWIKKAKTQGTDTLRSVIPHGREPKLSAEHRAQLPLLLAKGAEHYGFRGQVWTTARVARLIKEQFGVNYHPAHCSRLLRALGQSVQKPARRATQQDEAAIHRWNVNFDMPWAKTGRLDG